jgi:hypothetical protein
LCAGCLDRGHEFYCLSNLRKLRRRRKPFERKAEEIAGFDGAARRLIEPCEGERRAQFEGAGFLGSRDFDGGEEGGFGVRRIICRALGLGGSSARR